MIGDTVAFFKGEGREVIYDAEHFFDGARANEEYAFQTLRAAAEAGADSLVLCDTNGGSFPSDVYDWTAKAVREFSVPIGIHCHNDDGMAVANSVMAVEAGAAHVQGTLIGIGERCGNANLSTLIPTLQIKRGYACIPDDCLQRLTPTARLVAELSNMPLLSSCRMWARAPSLIKEVCTSMVCSRTRARLNTSSPKRWATNDAS